MLNPAFLSITYNTYSLFRFNNQEPTDIEQHALAVQAALRHLRGLMLLMALVDEPEPHQTDDTNQQHYFVLTEALQSVGELGAAIADHADGRFVELTTAYNKHIYKLGHEAEIQGRNQEKMRQRAEKEANDVQST